MPDAQIPILIMTPSVSCLADKLQIYNHPNWQPYAFECLELTNNLEEEEKNEYAKYRKWLIQKEKEFVSKQSSSA